jgi:hypothetical protein
MIFDTLFMFTMNFIIFFALYLIIMIIKDIYLYFQENPIKIEINIIKGSPEKEKQIS